MKITRPVLLFLVMITVTFLLSVCFTSCSGGGDGYATQPYSDDGTSADTEPLPDAKKITVINDEGKSAYLIVRPDVTSAVITSATSKLYTLLLNLDTGIQVTTDWARNPVRSDYEILIDKTDRETEDFYIVDRELLGAGGYIVKVVDNKIIIAGGDDVGTAAAVDHFISLITDDGKLELPADYEYTDSLDAVFHGAVCGGTSLADFAIVCRDDSPVTLAAAAMFRSLMFNKCGVMMPAPTSAEGSEHTVSFSLDSGEATTFSITSENGNISVSGSARIGLCRGVRDAFEEFCRSGGSVLDISGGFTKNYGTVVTYEDFGAVGDGKNDDIAAIVNAHAYANTNKLPVFAREDAEYYIGGKKNVATVMTDTDWSVARFIIDDRNVESRGTHVFVIPATASYVDVKGVTSLKAGQTNIGVTLPGDSIVSAVNSDVRQYIRYGSNQDNGYQMTDYFIVHADGSVDPTTPILWDFDKITSIKVLRYDTEPLTLKGGVITTIANAESSNYNYYYRGIRIYRSNVTVDGLTHYITGEGNTGAPYYGILIISDTVNDVIRNVTFTGHKTYKTIGSAGTSVSMGTYDITVTNSLGFHAENCTQTTDINDTAYWGVFASNYSKNIVFDNCNFSRFDAHRGVCGVTLKNCSLGHQGINLIGHGTALIENCTVYSKTFVNLRSDYGSTWDGDLVIRNCTFIAGNGKGSSASIVGGSYDGTHDFGYVCHLPENIIIDGLYVKCGSAVTPTLFANINTNWKSDSYVAKYPMVITKSVKVRNFSSSNNKGLEISDNKYMFKGLVIGEFE